MATFTLTGTFGADFNNSDTISLTASSGTVSPDTATKSDLAGGLTITADNDVTVTATCSSGNCIGTIQTIQTPLAAGIVYDCNTKNNSGGWATASFNCETGAVTLTPTAGTTTISNVSPATLTTNSGNQTVTFSFSDSDNVAYSNAGATINGCEILVNTNVATSVLISGPTSSTIGTNITLTASDTCIPGTPTYTWSGSAIDGLTGSSQTFTEGSPGLKQYTVSTTYNNVTYTDSHDVNFLSSSSVDVVYVAGGRANGVAAYNTENITLRANTTNISNASYQWYKLSSTPSGGNPVVDHPTNNNAISGATSQELTISEPEGTNTTVYYNCRVSGNNSVDNSVITPVIDPTNFATVWSDRPSFSFYRLPSQSIDHNEACSTTLGQVTLYTDNAVLPQVEQLYTTAAGGLNQFPGAGTFVATYNSIKYYAYVTYGGDPVVAAVQGNWFPCTSYNIETTAGDDGGEDARIDADTPNTITLKFVNQDNGIDPAITQYSWRVNNNPAGTNQQTFSTDATKPTPTPGNFEDVLYACEVTFNDGRPNVIKTITIRWTNPNSLIVTAVKCGGNTVRYFRVNEVLSLNTSNNNVYKLSGAENNILPEGDGCYTVTPYSSGQIEKTVNVDDLIGYSGCTPCGCDPTSTSEFESISVSEQIKYIYADGGAYNNVTLSVSVTNAVCIDTGAQYKWYAGTSTNQANHVLIKTTSSNSATINYQELTNAGLSITPGSTLVHYHCKLFYTIGQGSSQNSTSESTQAMSWINLPEFTLSYLNSGTASNPDDSICSSSSGSVLYPVFGNEGQSPGQDNLLLATKFYANAERTQTPANGTWKSNYAGNATNIYTYLLGGVPQTPTGAVSGTNWRACAANFALTSNRGDSGYTLCNNLTANLFANYDPNVLTLNTSTYEWRVNNVLQTSSNGSTSFTASNPGGTGLVTYSVTVQDTSGTPYTDTFEITWQACSVKVQARKCGNSSGYVVVTILGTESIANGVFNLTAEPGQQLPEGNGCYTILQTTTESANAEVTAVGPNGGSGQPYSDCETCDPSLAVDEYYVLIRCVDNGTFRTAQTTDQVSYATNQFLVDNSNFLYRVVGTTESTSSPTATNLTNSPATSCPVYYGLQQCDTLETGFRTNNSTTEDTSLSINDRIVVNSTGIYYKVISTDATTGGIISNYSNTGLTGCPPVAQFYYGIEKCDDGVLYRTQASNTAVSFSLNQIVETGSGGITFRVFSTSVGVNDYAQYSLPVQASALTTCPLGAYTCNTHSDWVTVSYNSATEAISVTPTRNTTTVHSYSPTTAAIGSGNVAITFTFSDSNTAYSNANTQVTCQNGAIVDTGEAAITYYARFVTCEDANGTFINVTDTSPIDSTIVLSDGTECYQFVNNNLASPNADISTYTIYDSQATAALNCADCANVVNPPPPPPEPVCYNVLVTYTATDPATDSAAMETLCTGRQRAVNMNGNGLSLSTQIYSDLSCTTLRATPLYYADSSHYYYWDGSTLTQINSLNCQ